MGHPSESPSSRSLGHSRSLSGQKGSKNRSRDDNRASKDPAQDGHRIREAIRKDTSKGASSSARLSASTQSPVRSSGASRDLPRRQHSSGRTSSSSKPRPAASPQLEATASTPLQPALAGQLPGPPGIPNPADAVPAVAAQPETAISPERFVPVSDAPPKATVNGDAPGLTQVITPGPASLALDPSSASDKPVPSADLLPFTEAAVPASIADGETAGHAYDILSVSSPDEPQPKRPKPFQFGRGLASRKSAAQADLISPEPAATAVSVAPNVSDADTPAQMPTPQAPHALAQPTNLAESMSAEPAASSPPQTAALAVPAEPPYGQLRAPTAPSPSLEDLLARNSPGSMHHSSYSQILTDMQALNTHKSQLESRVQRALQQVDACQQQVQEAQVIRDAQLRQLQLRTQAAEGAAQLATQLSKVESELAGLESATRQPPADMPEVSQSSEEDLSISGQDESDSDDRSVAMDAPDIEGAMLEDIDGQPRAPSRLKAFARALQLLEADSEGGPASHNIAYLLNHGHCQQTVDQASALKQIQHWLFVCFSICCSRHEVLQTVWQTQA